eukprot:scaffold116786_cov40-Tisochrysis_lutea.AAC.3
MARHTSLIATPLKRCAVPFPQIHRRRDSTEIHCLLERRDPACIASEYSIRRRCKLGLFHHVSQATGCAHNCHRGAVTFDCSLCTGHQHRLSGAPGHPFTCMINRQLDFISFPHLGNLPRADTFYPKSCAFLLCSFWAALLPLLYASFYPQPLHGTTTFRK